MEQLASPRARPDTASTQEQKGMKKTETCAWPSSSSPARIISTVSLTASPSLSAASQRWAAFARQCQTSPTWPSGWAQVVFSHPVHPSRHSPPVSILRRDAFLGTPSQSPVRRSRAGVVGMPLHPPAQQLARALARGGGRQRRQQWPRHCRQRWPPLSPRSAPAAPSAPPSSARSAVQVG